MVAIRVSEKSPPICTPLDCDNPNKKIKLLDDIQPLNINNNIIINNNHNHKIDEQLIEENDDDDDNENGDNDDDHDNDDHDGDDHDGDDDEEEEDMDESYNDAEPIGDVIRVSNHSGENRNHFRGFQFDGFVFNLEDTVLVAPEEGKEKPSVTIIKDIFQPENGSLTVRGQRLYRPEEAEKNVGGTWESHDARELFYSSCLDELDTCNVMHKCIIHFIPMGATVPDKKEQPGFIVQKFYNFTTKKIRNLTAKDCEGFSSQAGETETQ